VAVRRAQLPLQNHEELVIAVMDVRRRADPWRRSGDGETKSATGVTPLELEQRRAAERGYRLASFRRNDQNRRRRRWCDGFRVHLNPFRV
jgi:hypothetical protein